MATVFGRLFANGYIQVPLLDEVSFPSATKFSANTTSFYYPEFDEYTTTSVPLRQQTTRLIANGQFDEYTSISTGGGSATYATGGTVISISGYKVHMFTASDTFATTSNWPSGLTIEYLVVGGGGGAGYYFGGGGAGGLLTDSGVAVAASTNYAVTVGAAGAGGFTGLNGNDSSLIGGAIDVTSLGGGGLHNSTPYNGFSGGSGGGGGTDTVGTNGTGGAGTPGQGNAGANAVGSYAKAVAGGGGGAGYPGAGAAGGSGMISDMLIAYSASTITLYSGGWDTYTFTVSSGLWFETNQAIYISNSSDPSIQASGIITSYSGTTLQCKLYSSSYSSGTFSGWDIKYAHAGGGVGYEDGGTLWVYWPGGGGGLYFDTYYDGLPNSGGGAGGGGGVYGAGGSGVVMIKYAYP